MNRTKFFISRTVRDRSKVVYGLGGPESDALAQPLGFERMVTMTTNAPRPRVNLAAFDGSSLDRGRGRLVEVAWWACKVAIIQTNFPWPSIVRKTVLIAFGAKIGSGFYIRPGVNIHFPWKFTAGDNVWIGDRCTILNLEPVQIGSNSALAHEVYLAAGGHDIRSGKFDYANAPITLADGVWVGTRAYVGPGVKIGDLAVVAAGAVVTKDVDSAQIVAGVPARPIGHREIRNED